MSTRERPAATCHCGRTVESRDPDPWEGRMDGYCYECATNRCDCYPDECPVKYPPERSAASTCEDEEVLAMWRRGELVVRTGRIHHGNLCVCPEKGDGEWCDKCEGFALEQGQ